MQRKLTHNVTIFELVANWPPGTGTHPVQVFGFGAANREEADEEGAKFAAGFAERSGREHRVDVRLFCDVCKVSGIKPGTKHKPCDACHGRGSVADPRAVAS